MRKFLIKLHIIQEKRQGPGIYSSNFRRLNPYNPLSYIFLILTFIVGVFMYGFIGFWNELEDGNPFKWR